MAVYELSEQGREEFRRLYDVALTEVRPTTPLAFQTAIAMLPLVTRADATALLEERLANLDREAEESRTSPPIPGTRRRMRWRWWTTGRRSPGGTRVARRGCSSASEHGELSFLGEPMDWTPADDDPGYQMRTTRSATSRCCAAEPWLDENPMSLSVAAGLLDRSRFDFAVFKVEH